MMEIFSRTFCNTVGGQDVTKAVRTSTAKVGFEEDAHGIIIHTFIVYAMFFGKYLLPFGNLGLTYDNMTVGCLPLVISPSLFL